MCTEQGRLCDVPAAGSSQDAPPARHANRFAQGGDPARPHTLGERMRYLLAEAQDILARPEANRDREVRWARDMLSTGIAGTRR